MISDLQQSFAAEEVVAVAVANLIAFVTHDDVASLQVARFLGPCGMEMSQGVVRLAHAIDFKLSAQRREFAHVT